MIPVLDIIMVSADHIDITAITYPPCCYLRERIFVYIMIINRTLIKQKRGDYFLDRPQKRLPYHYTTTPTV